ncbi:hypothetical protein Clacol_001587 [Clathrus columnatus]|uniref:Thiol methyltransferase 2 n=1 Tax=Clathrus columnatus TaxID=1419009 RepID=A0AAV5A305_9AGAM|nr:hypothetical protein Clacol_001587 [Clathrus columnatus]
MTTRIGVDPSILEKLQDIVSKDREPGSMRSWNSAWLNSATPWEGGQAQPPLQHLLESCEIDFPRSGTALVPGCGKGHDLIVINSLLGLQVLGVDFAPKAIETARNHLENTVPELIKGENIRLQQVDFFELEGSYDLVFFQALQPEMRSKWGAQMYQLVKPGGYIIILAFPTNAPLNRGPPFGIEQNTHAQFLGGGGWEKVLDRVPEKSSTTHVGIERLLVFKRLADQ